MRILGQIPHPDLIITVFKSGTKFILKFEAGPFEQSYKFLESDGLSSFEDMTQLVTESVIQEIYQVFNKMNDQYRLMNHKFS